VRANQGRGGMRKGEVRKTAPGPSPSLRVARGILRSAMRGRNVRDAGGPPCWGDRRGVQGLFDRHLTDGSRGSPTEGEEGEGGGRRGAKTP